MRALVIYESMFGNTKRVAGAIADGIASQCLVETVEVSHAPIEIPDDIDLLVVGGPTHVHGMTTVRTRTSAHERTPGALVSPGIGIREWLDQARPAAPDIPTAAFDTRINGPAWLTGSAAGGFAKRLRSAGFRLLAPARSFLVAKDGPIDDLLIEGELEGARAWGAALAAQAAPVRETVTA
jgi:Flavodoxin